MKQVCMGSLQIWLSPKLGCVLVGKITENLTSGGNYPDGYHYPDGLSLMDDLAPFYGLLVPLLSLFPYQCQLRPPVSLWWWIHGKTAACEPCWAVCSSLVSRVVKCTKIQPCDAALISQAKKGRSLRVQDVRWKHECSLSRKSLEGSHELNDNIVIPVSVHLQNVRTGFRDW